MRAHQDSAAGGYEGRRRGAQHDGGQAGKLVAVTGEADQTEE